MSYNNNGLGVPTIGGTEVKVATYVRVSTVFEEQDSSVINQAEGLLDYIRKKDGWVLYEPYSERQSSFKERKEFKRLRINPRTLDTYSLNLDFSYRFTFFKPEFLLPLIPGF